MNESKPSPPALAAARAILEDRYYRPERFVDGAIRCPEYLAEIIDKAYAAFPPAAPPATFVGSRTVEAVPGISLGCITPEARDLLDRIMEAWTPHLEGIKASAPNHDPGYYGFAYWLVRWSGLVQPAGVQPVAAPPATVAATLTPEIRDALEVAQIVLDNFASLASWAGGDSGNEWIWAENNEPYAQAEAALKVIDEALAGLLAEPAAAPTANGRVTVTLEPYTEEPLVNGKPVSDTIEVGTTMYADSASRAWRVITVAQLESAAPLMLHDYGRGDAAPPTRTVTAVDLAVCPDGHVTPSNPRPGQQFLVDCGHWCWMDAHYCGTCAKPVAAPPPSAAATTAVDVYVGSAAGKETVIHQHDSDQPCALCSPPPSVVDEVNK